MISEHSDSTATPDRQERRDFLLEKNLFIADKVSYLRKNVISFNEDKVAMFIRDSEKNTTQKKDKLRGKIQALIDKAKEIPVKEKQKKIKTILDPRGGITRRFANYVPIKRYQYTNDTQNIFYPNVSDKYYKKLSSEWKLAHESGYLRNTIKDELVLYSYLTQFGETEEVLAIYKKFRNVTCENRFILAKFRSFREKITKKRASFAVPGCSAKVEEGINKHTIIKTHKELFCRRCEIYDCTIHGILGISNFMHPNSPSQKELAASYKQMIEAFEYKKLKIKENCGQDCFCAPGKAKNIEEEFDDFTVAKIRLGVSVFMFEPCHIRLYFNKDQITCYQIFKFLKEMDPNLSAVQNGPKEVVRYAKDYHRSKFGTKKIKKHYFPNWKKLDENIKGTFAIDYQPCYHHQANKVPSEEEQSCKNSSCCCFERGFCDKYCGCDIKKCKLRRKGCDCKSNCIGKKCPCHTLNTECDPDLCKCCFTTVKNGEKKYKTNNCANQMLYWRKSKICKVGPSDVCTGLGLFNVEPVAKGEFVCMYIGELISWEEAEIREQWNVYDHETYLCTVSDEHVIDAKYRGNKARFINHGKSHANLMARNVFSRGLYHFGFYAKDDIAPGSELLFDYEGGGSALREQFSWIKNPAIPKIIPKFIPKSTNSWFDKDCTHIALRTGVRLTIGLKLKLTVRPKIRKLRKIEVNNLEEDDEDENYPKYYAFAIEQESPQKLIKIESKNEKIEDEVISIVDSDDCKIISIKPGNKKVGKRNRDTTKRKSKSISHKIEIIPDGDDIE